VNVSVPVPEPVFLDGPAGRLFAVHYAPVAHPPTGHPAVLYLPPFAEKMNRSRRMAALLGRRLAVAGVGLLVLDPYGTGDSEGDFARARWETWCADAAAALAWLRARGYEDPGVVGLRLGACLALAVVAAQGGGVSMAVLWNPVVRGELFLNQFLRIRAAAGIARGDGGESAKVLRQRLRDGQSVTVAGYPLVPQLAAAVGKLDLGALALGCPSPIAWFEVGGDTDAPLPPAAAAVVERLRAAGIDTRARSVRGEAFWTIEETVVVDDLLEATTALWSPCRPAPTA